MASGDTKDVFGKILGVLFILFGLPKLLSVPGAVENFNLWRLGDGWRFVVGMIEVCCGLSMFVPALKRFGAFGFFCLMPAAFLVHVTVGQYAMTAMPVVVGVAVLVYLQRQQVLRLRQP